jgi:hypothetical protein
MSVLTIFENLFEYYIFFFGFQKIVFVFGLSWPSVLTWRFADGPIVFLEPIANIFVKMSCFPHDTHLLYYFAQVLLSRFSKKNDEIWKNLKIQRKLAQSEVSTSNRSEMAAS